jgi:hypothetical protein
MNAVDRHGLLTQAPAAWLFSSVPARLVGVDRGPDFYRKGVADSSLGSNDRMRHMRDALIFVLFVAVAVLAYLVHSQNAVLTNQLREVKDLSAEIEAKHKTHSLELQAECSKQAARVFKADGWDKKKDQAVYQNHYNEKLNKCFVLEVVTTMTAGQFMTTKFLSDAFEGKTVANYSWVSDKVKKYWEVAPFVCSVTLPSGEGKACQSSDEFDELIKSYLE